MEFNVTAAEMLTYMRDEVFKGVDIDAVTLMSEDERREFTLRQADRLIGRCHMGDSASRLAYQFFVEEIKPVKENPLMQEPQEGVVGWIVELMRLLAYLFSSLPFDLNWIISGYKPIEGDMREQFFPGNAKLESWLNDKEDEVPRVVALVAKILLDQAYFVATKIDSALSDYYVAACMSMRPDWSDKQECMDYTECVFSAIDRAHEHLLDGYSQGLRDEEIGLVDSMWAYVPHDYPENYVEAACEIWQKIEPITKGFAGGHKSKEDCDRFVKDMVEMILPIAEKHEVDMELDDEFSLALAYVKDWLTNIYYGNEPIFG
jgi:hypothetical protein